MAEKRLAYKDFARLRRFIKAAQKAEREHREWMEEQTDTLGCYVDKWFPRVGFFTDDDGKRVKVKAELTKEARRRNEELRRAGEKVNRELERLATKLKTYPDLIDIKTGKVTKPEGLHDEVGDPEPEAKAEEDKGEAADTKAEGFPIEEKKT